MTDRRVDAADGRHYCQNEEGTGQEDFLQWR